jgi:hypothetical protein
MTRLVIFGLLVTLTACASTGKKLNRVALGMSKPQVIDVMGDPDSTKASDGIEVLVYGVDKMWSTEVYSYSGDYWIVLKDGKVAKYGKPGDFGTAEPAAIRVQLEQH